MMNDKKIVARGFLHSVAACIYIVAVATLMSNGERVFGRTGGVLVPIGVLLLLIVSAAVMGALVFGKPVMLYIDGKKREAVALVICTIGSLAFITLLFFAALAVHNR